MDKLKKEWKSIIVVLWIVFITLFLFSLSGKMDRLQAKSDKIIDTLGTMEGVLIGADSGGQDILKRMDGIESQINYIVKKLRRR